MNEEEENLITQDDLGKIKSAFNKNKADFLKRKHAKLQPLTIGECIEPEPQTKRWENVKPKGIIQALKEEACDPNVNNHGLHYTKYSKDEDGYFRK